MSEFADKIERHVENLRKLGHNVDADIFESSLLALRSSDRELSRLKEINKQHFEQRNEYRKEADELSAHIEKLSSVIDITVSYCPDEVWESVQYDAITPELSLCDLQSKAVNGFVEWLKSEINMDFTGYADGYNAANKFISGKKS